MDSISYRWNGVDRSGACTLVHVRGTHDEPYAFGAPAETIHVMVRDFFIGIVPVTQSFWQHITGSENPAVHRAANLPVENVSWDALKEAGGFLDQVNESAAALSLIQQAGRPFILRLPTETEWEYAARGGPHWRDRYKYSGSNDIDAVAWYDRRHGDCTQPVAGKAPNQLGLYDMSGNVWEWCADTFTPELSAIHRDGTAHEGLGDERVLRGGCFHNWAMHCTVSKRYAMTHDFHDGCIGFRLVMGEPEASASSGT